jgi:hypothetical protein
VPAQELLPEPAVERLDERVVRRLSRAAEIQCDAYEVDPQVQHPPGELRPVVHPQAGRGAPLPDRPLQDLDHLPAGEAEAEPDSQALAGEDVQHVRHPGLPAGRL